MRAEVVFLLIAIAAVILLILLTTSQRQNSRNESKFQKWTTEQLSDFLSSTPRAVADDGDCTAACEELFRRENYQPTDTLCAVDFCRNMYYNECVPCRLDQPGACESEEALLATLAVCEDRDAGDGECDIACDTLFTRQEEPGWGNYCASGYCARKSTPSDYCCTASAFPDTSYCSSIEIARELINSQCTGGANTADCSAACTTTASKFEWNPRGEPTLSNGACSAQFCFDEFSGKSGVTEGACYYCSLSERNLCTESDLILAIDSQCAQE